MDSKSDLSSGVTSESVQHAICEGQNYSRREYSPEERQAACQRYKALIDERNNVGQSNVPLMLEVGLIVLAIGVGLAVYFALRHKNAKKKTHKKRDKRS